VLERVVFICSRGTIEHVADRQGQASVLTGISADQDVDSSVRYSSMSLVGISSCLYSAPYHFSLVRILDLLADDDQSHVVGVEETQEPGEPDDKGTKRA
jgi:hypothetical protein